MPMHGWFSGVTASDPRRSRSYARGRARNPGGELVRSARRRTRRSSTSGRSRSQQPTASRRSSSASSASALTRPFRHHPFVRWPLDFHAAGLAAYTWSERPDLAERAEALEPEVWPEYNLHSDVVGAYWGCLREAFSDFQFVVVDEAAADELVAEGHSIPCGWDGTIEGLPAGIDAAIEGGVRFPGMGKRPTALCALAIEIRPSRQGAGLSSRMLQTMAALGAAHGLADLIAPVRPSWKERYPLTPIEHYAGWRRSDGLPFDPWMRVHARLGGEVLRPEPRSLRITATVAEGERWTGRAFPESGEYTFPRGLAPLAIDREDDRGTYHEPNVWMRHRLSLRTSPDVTEGLERSQSKYDRDRRDG